MNEIEQYIQLVFEKYGWSEARGFKESIIDFTKQEYEKLKKEKEEEE